MSVITGYDLLGKVLKSVGVDTVFHLLGGTDGGYRHMKTWAFGS